MTVHTSGGSPVAQPQQFHTLPTVLITQAEQHDRWLNTSELKTLSDFLSSGMLRLQIAETLAQHSDAIVSAAANRIFYGGAAMAYLERPPNRENLPGYTPPPRRSAAKQAASRAGLTLRSPSFGNPLRRLTEFLQSQLSPDRDPLPGGFRPIHIGRYGEARMKRSMRDLDWFLRYVVYAIAAGDCSILTVNVRGLRGVIPEDVTEATIVSLREMRWRSLGYFKSDAAARAIIQEPFDVAIAEYQVEKPPMQVRLGVANDQQGLQLPSSYAVVARPRFVFKPGLAETEMQAVIKAAYRQVFERDVTREYGVMLTALESRLRSGEYSTQEFVRQLGLSRLYRDLCYEPFSISRVIERATRHFLGRGLSSIEEFQRYFEVISTGGLSALVNTLVDSPEYADYFGEETVPYLRGLGQEAQECRNWGAQHQLFQMNAAKVPQFITRFGEAQQPLPNQHPYGAGNDLLEIQFGTIFPQRGHEKPHEFGSTHRRILIGCEPSQDSRLGAIWGKAPGSLEQRVFRLSQPNLSQPNLSQPGDRTEQGVSLNLARHSADAVIEAAYRQVLGRSPLSDQRSAATESRLKSGEITVRELVRDLAKSRLFRSLYWDSLYITKAIEAIHRRLLGRPTYGREEMSRYYDLCARQGFYALIDAILDSLEYIETFREDTVPYERFITPRGYELRSRHHANGSVSPVGGVRVAEGTWMREAMERMKYYQNGQGNGFEENGGDRSLERLESISSLQSAQESHREEQEMTQAAETSEPESISAELTALS
jgi:phycobilisome core-membrane linker protein